MKPTTTTTTTTTPQVIVYRRVSTDKQETAQQARTIDNWLHSHGITATRVVDEMGVSGGIEYSRRRLGTEIVPSMQKGDTLVVAELSRIGRSMSDLNKLIANDLKPRGARLIICNTGMDIDFSGDSGSTTNAQFILTAISYAAETEKNLIRERTRSALRVRQQRLADEGQFTSKTGNVCTKLGAPAEALPKARAASAQIRREKAQSDPNNVAIWKVLKPLAKRKKSPTTAALKKAVVTFAERDIRTSTGKTLNVTRARALFYHLRDLYTETPAAV